MPITYSTELKVKTIRRYEKGESIKALSQELHISQSTLYQWRKEYCSIKTPNHTYTPAEFDAISRRLQKLEHHMEIIRQTEYLSNIPLQKKLATLEKLYHRPGNPFSVHELCDALDAVSYTHLGVLEIAVQDFRGTVVEMEKELLACRRRHDDEAAGVWSRTLRNFRCSKDDNAGKKSLIGFLVRNNVLPKYGFPVDTVELIPDINAVGRGKALQLARDLQMAIAEYAPGAEVVADGHL